MAENNRGINYMHYRKGDIIKIEIRDETYRILYKKKFNIMDKNAILSLLRTLEEFSGFSIIEIIKEKMKIRECF